MTNKPIEEPKVNIPRQVTTPGYRHHRIVPMLRKHEDRDLNLPMVVLTSRENAEVKAKAFADTVAMFGGKPPKEGEMGVASWNNIYETQESTWIVFYSVRVPNDLTKKWFLSKQAIEEDYSEAEVGILAQNYVSVVLTQPHLTVVDFSKPNAFQAMIDQIKEQGEKSDFFLNGLTTHSVNQFIKFLIADRENLQKNTGLSGTP